MNHTRHIQATYHKLTHNRFKCFFVTKCDDDEHVFNLSIPNLMNTKISSIELSESTARTIGEIFIKVADIIKEN